MRSLVWIVLVVFVLGLEVSPARAAQPPGILRAAIESGLPPLADSARRQVVTGRAMELKWEELSQVIRGNEVEMSLDGVRIRGEVISVRDDALLVDVRRTTNEHVIPRESASIPRSSISDLVLRESRGSWGRNLGTTLGVMTGFVVGIWVAGNVADSASVGIPMWLGIASAITVGGYQVGKTADMRTVHIRIVR